MVSDGFDEAGGLEAAEHLSGVCGVDESPFVVAFFRPGVGEIDMEAIDGIVGDKAGQKVGGVGAEKADIIERPSANTVDGIAIISGCPFDSEKIDLRAGACLVEEEGSAA